MWWWPLGLLMLAFLITRVRFGCWRHSIYAGDGPMLDWEHSGERGALGAQDRRLAGKNGTRARAPEWTTSGPQRLVRSDLEWRPRLRRLSLGKLKRLEGEQREFEEFLARLRFAKDRAEFDQFMAERRPEFCHVWTDAR